MRIMGRGRTGIGIMRWSHVFLKVEVIDFDEKIAKSENSTEKSLWLKRKALVENLKADPPTFVVQGKKPSGRRMRVPEDEDTTGAEAK
jgi:hypothetical protein